MADSSPDKLMGVLASIERDQICPTDAGLSLKHLIDDSVPAVQRALALRCLGYSSSYDVLESLLYSLADTDERVTDEALTSIRQVVPWSGLSPWGYADNPDRCFDAPLARLLDLYRDDARTIERILKQLARLEGAFVEIGRALSLVNHGLAEQFNAILDQRQAQERPAQVMVIPSYRCNLRCSYCYVLEKINEPQPEINFRQFSKIVDQAESIGCTRIGFSGGEPTIHPDFGAMLDLLKQRCLSSFFSSNMSFHPDMITHFDPASLGSITAHLRPASEFNKKSWQLFLDNLSATRQAGIHVLLRYSVTPNERIDLLRIQHVCAQTGVNHVNIALAIPSTCGTNKHVDVDALKDYVHELVNALRTLQRMGLNVGVSKPIPPCLLQPRDQRLLSKLPFAMGTCTVWQVNNTHNIVINPDGSVWPCIAVEEDLGSFSDCKDLKKMGDRVKQRLNARANQPLFDDCANCDLQRLRRCQGACLAYK